MRMKKATAFGLAALMAATMIPAVPAMAKGDDSEGSVYYLNFKRSRQISGQTWQRNTPMRLVYRLPLLQLLPELTSLL